MIKSYIIQSCRIICTLINLASVKPSINFKSQALFKSLFLENWKCLFHICTLCIIQHAWIMWRSKYDKK